MCIEETGDDYRLDSTMSAEYMNTFDSRINNLNNAKNDLKKLIDSMLSPSQVNAANNAFNIAANIFPGGASLKDINNGDFWKKNKCYQYFKLKRRAFINAFKEQNPKYNSAGSGQYSQSPYVVPIGCLPILSECRYIHHLCRQTSEEHQVLLSRRRQNLLRSVISVLHPAY